MKRTLRLKRCMAFLLILTLVLGGSPVALAGEAVDLTKLSGAENQPIQRRQQTRLMGLLTLSSPI